MDIAQQPHQQSRFVTMRLLDCIFTGCRCKTTRSMFAKLSTTEAFSPVNLPSSQKLGIVPPKYLHNGMGKQPKIKIKINKSCFSDPFPSIVHALGLIRDPGWTVRGRALPAGAPMSRLFPGMAVKAGKSFKCRLLFFHLAAYEMQGMLGTVVFRTMPGFPPPRSPQ